MCSIRRFDPKTRRIYFAANLCLIAGLLPTLFRGSWMARHADWLDGVRGFFLGLAISLLFWVARRRRGAVATGDGATASILKPQ